MSIILTKMKPIPIDIVNYICEFAASKDKLWYPYFCHKSEKLSWKVNPYCNKYNELSRKLLNTIFHIPLVFHNLKTGEEREVLTKIIQFTKSYTTKLYIEFDLDNDNSNIFIVRGGYATLFNIYVSSGELYLNGTQYANIIYGWTLIQNNEYKRMFIAYDMY